VALTPPFALPADLEARWRTLATAETERATVLLTDASQKILDEDRRNILATLTTPTPTLVRIVCAMVQRAMSSGTIDSAPVTQQSWGAGPFNASSTYANPMGDLYLTKSERRELRFSRQVAGGVDMWADSDQYATEA